MAGLADADVLDALADVDAPNEPAALATQGAGGTRLVVSTTEQRERRHAMSQLLMQGTSMDGIFKILMLDKDPKTGKQGFNMTQSAILALRDEVWATWADEDAESRPYYKSATMRRLHSEIVQAKSDHSWSAVAMLEKTMMEVQGTAEPLEVNLTGDVRLTRSIIEVLGEEDAPTLRQMIDDERKRYESERALEAENIIDAVGESVG